MRVIEPRRSHKTKMHLKKNRWPTLTSSLLIIFGSLSLLAWNYHARNSLIGIMGVLSQNTSKDARINSPSQQGYRYFAAPEFQELSGSFIYPNTQKITQPPSITGNSLADARLRIIASSRGYTLQSVPVATIVSVPNANILLQEKAAIGWSSLQANAQAQNIPLAIQAGYRSIEMQRELFSTSLKDAKISVQQIASGQVDSQLVTVLRSVAIPGYSKHQTGFTIDLACNGFTSFKASPCYQWMSSNNYLNAKQQGWIPSFPEGLSENSPEPDYAQFEWVGRQPLLQR